MLENTSKCFSAPLPVTASKCYCAPLPVTASKCYCAPLPVTAPQPFQFQLVSIAKTFTYSLPAASSPPSGTATVIVYNCPVLCSSPSIVTTVRDYMNSLNEQP